MFVFSVIQSYFLTKSYGITQSYRINLYRMEWPDNEDDLDSPTPEGSSATDNSLVGTSLPRPQDIQRGSSSSAASHLQSDSERGNKSAI